jgi:hypothetical protein
LLKRFFRVDEIFSFWHAVVAGMLFGADRYATQRNFIGFDDVVMAQQFHRVRRLFDQDAVDGICLRVSRGGSGQQEYYAKDRDDWVMTTMHEGLAGQDSIAFPARP